MKMRDLLLGTAIVGCILTTGIIFLSPTEKMEVAAERAMPIQPISSQAIPSVKEQDSTKKFIMEESSFPTAEKVRSEVGANPHAIPNSVMEFADQLAPKMEEAMNSQAQAKFLAEFLAKCTREHGEQSLVPSVKALCLINLKRLSSKYASLEALYDSASEGADSSVRSIVRYL